MAWPERPYPFSPRMLIDVDGERSLKPVGFMGGSYERPEAWRGISVYAYGEALLVCESSVSEQKRLCRCTSCKRLYNGFGTQATYKGRGLDRKPRLDPMPGKHLRRIGFYTGLLQSMGVAEVFSGNADGSA